MCPVRGPEFGHRRAFITCNYVTCCPLPISARSSHNPTINSRRLRPLILAAIGGVAAVAPFAAGATSHSFMNCSWFSHTGYLSGLQNSYTSAKYVNNIPDPDCDSVHVRVVQASGTVQRNDWNGDYVEYNSNPAQFFHSRHFVRVNGSESGWATET
jgi:hypothetical protein